MSDRMASLRKMLEAEPNDPFCLYGLAQEYAKQGELEQAVAFYERTIETDPAYCYAYYHLARVLEERDETERARSILEAGLEQARHVGDQQAVDEIAAYLDVL